MLEEREKVRGRGAAESEDRRTDYDVIIIGGGAAGLSAALWCDELGLGALVLEAAAEAGGQLLRVYNPIENHLGARARNGREMRDLFLKQVAGRRFDRRVGSEVSAADLVEKRVFLSGGEGDGLCAGALVAATGVRRRKLNVEGEEEFRDRGILESGKRDAAKVAGKHVLVVGGGDAALENALILAETAEKVFLVHRRREFRARPEFTAAAAANEKVKILTETVVTRITGGGRVEAVTLRELPTGAVFTLPVSAVLPRIGVRPNTEIFRGQLELDAGGYVKVGASCETSAPGVFAVGDVANPLAPTVSSAVGMGATAAKAIFDKLRPGT